MSSGISEDKTLTNRWATIPAGRHTRWATIPAGRPYPDDESLLWVFIRPQNGAES